MSTIKEVGLILFLILGLSCVLLGWFSVHEIKKQAADKIQLKDLQNELKQAQLAAERQQKVQTVTGDVVAKVTLQTRQVDLKAKQISHKVDVITGKVKNDQISDDAADAAYASSMLEAYCQAVPTDGSKCTPGQLNSGL